MELTPEQKSAAEAEGSAAVTAGAGTGKTRMLAERYLYHLQADGLSPLSVVAVTFTDKAAAELRSRIRETLNDRLADEHAIAEVEAAQISTMHALAARICRDFYDLADIPADFVVLDETASPLWLAEKFDEAVSAIDPEVIEELGFHWLTSALEGLLKDPYSSERALSLGADKWPEAIEAAATSAFAKLTASDAWLDARTVLHDYSGAAGDILEGYRAKVLAAMSTIRGVKDFQVLQAAFAGFRINSGAAGNWDPDALPRVRECLGALRDAVKKAAEFASLEYGPEDEKAAARIAPLAAAFRQVRDHMAAEKLREKVLDFGDLEHYALKVLDHPEAIEHYSRRWRAFLVDEFQDTNPIQASILERLTRGATLTIVGDEKQAIYGFRGADVGVFSRVRQSIVETRGGKEVPLSVTFRTHRDLVVTMNDIFEPVLDALHQPLTATRLGSKLTAPFVHLASVEEVKDVGKAALQVIEARYIAAKIAELHASGVAYNEIAILSRAWAPLDVYLGVLSASGIPAVHMGGGSLLATREALDVYSLLCFLAEPTDGIPLMAVLRSPFFAFSDIVLSAAAKDVSDEVSWWDVVQKREEFARAASVLGQLFEARGQLASDGIFALADELTGYSSVVANLPYGSRRLADLRGMRELFRNLDRAGKGDVFGTTRYLRELIATETELPRPPLDAGDAVSLMTIHKSKGLEWPVIFVPDLARTVPAVTAAVLIDPEIGVAFQMDGEAYEKEQPAIHKLIKARISERERDEARRLLYVAVTRAKDKVFLTATKPKGAYLDILRPGLDAAKIVDEIIPYNDADAIAPSPGEPEPFPLPEHINTQAVAVGLTELPATALTVYARCPKQFEFQYVAGHPGLSEGGSAAMAIGSLAHLALELDIDDAAALRNANSECTDEQIADALRLARAFRTHPAFASVRSAEFGREVRLTHNAGGITIIGVADLVGPDFVLDYKTDAEADPHEHRFQLWAYAEALGKPRAMIAYLRKEVLHEWRLDELEAIRAEAATLIDRIRRADYAATPSPERCGYCPFEKICDSSVTA